MPEAALLPDPSSGSAAYGLLPGTWLACSPTGTAPTIGKTAACTAGVDTALNGSLSTLSWSCWIVLGAVLPSPLAVCSCTGAAPTVAASDLTDASETASDLTDAAGAGEACKVTPGPMGGGDNGVSFRLPTAGGLDGDHPFGLAGSLGFG